MTENQELYTSDAQRRVHANVIQRGYKNGWTDKQFIARQVVKLGEELGELAVVLEFFLPANAYRHLVQTGQVCRMEFGENKFLRAKNILADANRSWVRQELTDIVVICLVLAQAIGFDVISAAVEKSRSDISRGVR